MFALFSAPASVQVGSAALVNIWFEDRDGSGTRTCGDSVNYIATIGSEVQGMDLEDTLFELTTSGSPKPGRFR